MHKNIYKKMELGVEGQQLTEQRQYLQMTRDVLNPRAIIKIKK